MEKKKRKKKVSTITDKDDCTVDCPFFRLAYDLNSEENRAFIDRIMRVLPPNPTPEMLAEWQRQYEKDF